MEFKKQIDTIISLVDKLKQASYRQGNEDGIREAELTYKHWGRTEGIQDTVMTAIDEAYKRGYRDGQIDLRKEQEATERYWGKKPEATIETILQLIRNDIDAYLAEQGFGTGYRDEIKAFVKTPWEGKE